MLIKYALRPKLSWLTKTVMCSLLLLGVVLLLVEPPAGLSAAGAKCLGVAVICMTLWVFASIPLAATSLAAIVLLPAFNIVEQNRVFAYFGNSAVFFLLGVFILAGAMMHTGLSKRIALFFLTRFDASPRMVVIGILFTCSFLSFFMPEHGVAAMMFPVVMEIAQTLKLEKGKSPLAIAMFLAMAWGAITGGIGTLLGGARAPLALELLHEAYGRSISFADWALAAAPIAVTLSGVAYVILSRFFRPEIDDVTPARLVLEQEMQRIGPISKNELLVGLVAFITIGFWIFGGHKMGLPMISLAAAVTVFVLDLAKWKDVVDYVNWGVIVMYGGAIALGKALEESHAIDWLAGSFLQTSGVTPFMLIIILSALSKVFTEFISNAAVVIILVPLSFGLVQSSGVTPELMVLAITIPAGLDFCLPVGTPPNAIAYASGYYSIKRILAPGLVMSVTSYVVFLLFAKLYWPLIMK